MVPLLREPAPKRRRPRAGVARVLAVLVTLTSGILTAPLPAGAAPALNLSGGDSVALQQRSTAIAPGLDLTSFQRLQPGGWVTGHVMTADLSTPSLSLDLTDGQTVAGSNATVSDFANGAGGNVVAAVNGDYFDMNRSDAASGTNISSQGLRTAGASPRESFTVVNGKAVIQQMMAKATVTAAGNTITINSVNSPTFGANAIGLYTPVWGTFPVGRLVPADVAIKAVTIRDGVVVAVSTDRASIDADTALAAGEALLVAQGTAISQLDALTQNTTIDLTVGASADVDLSVGGSQRLVADGHKTTLDEIEAARTAIGVSRDGTKLWVVSLDGRQGDSHGMTIQELAQFMVDLGAYNAVNLDGGGSTTLVARPAGTTDLQLIDRPSDGHERLVSNALVFRSDATGAGTAVTARPALQPAAGLTVPGATDLLPGLTRTVVGTRLDANLAATEGGGSFTVSSTSVLQSVESNSSQAVIRGRKYGSATVSFSDGTRAHNLTFAVHGPLEQLRASTPLLAINSAQETGTISLLGVDPDGFTVPIETRDIRTAAGPGIRVEPEGLTNFRITPTQDLQSTSVTFTVLGKSVTVPVTVGYHEAALADFSDPSAWSFLSDRATGSLSAGVGPEGGPALTLDFDFSTTTATRGAYAVARTPIPVPGQPQALTLWIKGTNHGEWPRIMITKGDGTVTNLDPDGDDLITWDGWRQVKFSVPAGTPFPITVTRIRLMETRSTESYTDQISIADLKAQIPLSATIPEQPWISDPAVITHGTVAGRPQRIAVMSDTQFVARNPDSDLVQAGRRTLREIVAAKPDLLIINGDLVDEASPEDFALAKRVLDEEVGQQIPYIYVPGNHEIMGGPITNFSAVFGATATHRELIVRQGKQSYGTKIITLNSSSGNLHPLNSTEQWKLLEQQLAEAAANPLITGVVVFDHHPVDDPHPDKASQLTDRYEAAAYNRVLSDFGRRTGKSIALINGHVGTFFTDASDGLTRSINGNSGKSPSGAPDRGGFTGWSMLGINPQHGVRGAVPKPLSRLDWLQIETHARVDALTVAAPTSLQVGGTGKATAQLRQDGTRWVPVAWPVSAQWGGTGVFVGTGSAPSTAVVALDPATGTVTALRAGTATISVTVNGVVATAAIRVG